MLRQLFAMNTPSGTLKTNMIATHSIHTPIGTLTAVAGADGVCLLEFSDAQERLCRQMERLEKLSGQAIRPGDSPCFPILQKQLDEYFDGKRRQFDLPLDIPGSEFQKLAWRGLQAIPYGETRSYQQQATVLGRPQAVRAVAKANADNRLAIVIPCHRLKAKDGSLSGYGGGVWRKAHLLELESSTFLTPAE